MNTEPIIESEIGKKLLTELREKKITMPEFDKECAYWYIRYHDKLHPLPVPNIRPQDLIEYDRMEPHDKKSLPEKFWRQTEVYNYLEAKQGVIENNKSTLNSLKRFKEYIPIEDKLTRDKYDNLISEYEGWCNKPVPEDLQKAQEMFGGKLTKRDYYE